MTTTTTARAQQACLAWISDPSHAWLAVSLHPELGFPEAVEFASQYSYFQPLGVWDNGLIFLEEDVDAPAFIKAHGIDLDLVQTEHFDDTDHFIRNLVSARFILR